MIEDAEQAYRRAVEIIEVATIPPDPDAPSLHMWRLRPSEEAAFLIQRYLNPPPQWGIKLSLSATFLGPERCVSLGRKLILNNTITTLDLSMCDMQEEAAVEFFHCLKRNRCLKHLNLDGNNVGDKGATAAAECIHNLETLHMSCNDIHDKGAIAIASFLRNSSKIKTLNLRANCITFYGAYKLISALEPILERLSPALLERISIEEPVSSSDFDDLLNLSARPSTQGTFDVNGDIATEESAEKASHGKQNRIPPEDVYNETLHTLWLRHNRDIPEELFKIVETILAKRFPQPPKGISKKKIGLKSKRE
ncbi:hypothetical protein TCDM_02570 [Trypanosoma cruzi Dm28c]|uniref:Leucine-rich repeat protein (LRRP) n=2 Tax=Trypanosoma cruzi TaxID=5693 RepID=V5B5Y7_TRYCR|nr:hypothetical protein TCDM_02570 [Trypanosoma cruzi Dm28c]KAF8280693.1 hypothetical protein TcBrA4_0093720 [Trypanosoma cruzi]PBJ71070.1 hypothetical protein BCY84_17403 [Trypanosoma cruzi cruzi]PWU84235.1 hypothetical protein C4B63_242g33 [Trypanosoma cruzi]PWU88289.1 hypothetical protein C4B63_76g14 [Trypanosoma cruzi]